MELKQFYKEAGGDYDDVLARLGKEERIVKYLLRFAESDSWEDFDKAIANSDFEECFRVLHSMKGICLNLGLGNLEISVSSLCEEYRNKVPQRDLSKEIDDVSQKYYTTIALIKGYCDR